MRFIIKGVDRDTGQDRQVTVEAFDRNHAGRIAIASGIRVNSIDEVAREPEPPPLRPTGVDWARLERTIKMGVYQGVLRALLVLLLLWVILAVVAYLILPGIAAWIRSQN